MAASGMKKFGKIVENTLGFSNPFEKHLGIEREDIDTLSFDDKIKLLETIRTGMDIGMLGESPSIVGNKKMDEIFVALKNMFDEEVVDYEDYSIGRTISDIHYPNRKKKNVPKAFQLAQYMQQSIWNDILKEINALSLSQKEELKEFVDQITEFSSVEYANEHKDNPTKGLKDLQAKTELEKKILKLNTLANLIKLPEILAKKIAIAKTPNKLMNIFNKRK